MVDQSLATGAVAQVRIGFLRDLHNADDLIGRHAHRGIVYATPIQLEPIITLVAVRGYSKAIPVDAHAVRAPQRRPRTRLDPDAAAAAGGPLTEAQVDALIHEMFKRWSRPSPSPDVPLPPYAAETSVTNDAHPGDPEQGLRVYAEACASCHGADGKGGAKGGSVVDAAYLALVSDQALRTAVIAGRTDLGMPDWRSDIPGQPLTAQQISAVVAWLVSHRQPVVGRSGASVQVRRPEP